jgi:hypothetical protein
MSVAIFSLALIPFPVKEVLKWLFLTLLICQKNIDEIRYSMSNKLIDLIAFNETRLDVICKQRV